MRLFCISVLAVCALVQAGSAAAQDNGRGKLLYDNHCGSCHNSAIHGRKDRWPQSLDQLRAIVDQWQTAQKLGWNREEIDDVTAYLNATRYRF
jgi:mono/diheme cytochrome c family protein